MCGHSSHVQIRRHKSVRVMIEGCLSKEYYTIRDLLYQQYAIVEGEEQGNDNKYFISKIINIFHN
jgi:hypothetical protein